MEILDGHHHMSVIEGFAHSGYTAKGKRDNPDELEHRTRVAAMEASGIQRAIIGPAYQYLLPNGVADTAKINDRLAAFRDRDRSRFPFAIAACEPRQGDAALEEISRCKRTLGMAGVMFHSRLQGCYVDSPWMRNCLRAIVDEGMIPFVHSHHGDQLEAPWRVERLAKEFPNTTFIILDGLAGYEETELFYDVVERTGNLAFDTGMWSGGARKVSEVAKRIGHERLIFSSNLYSYPMGYKRSLMVEELTGSDLTDAQKRDVLALNLYRVLGQRPLGERRIRG